MNKALAIMFLFPESNPSKDFIVIEDNGVQTIVEWNINAPEPTEEELQQAWEEYLKQPEPTPEKPLEQQVIELQKENDFLRNRVSDVEMTLTEILFS